MAESRARRPRRAAAPSKGGFPRRSAVHLRLGVSLPQAQPQLNLLAAFDTKLAPPPKTYIPSALGILICKAVSVLDFIAHPMGDKANRISGSESATRVPRW